MYFTWKDEFNMNIKEIDDQHKRMFEIGRRITELLFSNESNIDESEINTIFKELKEYAKYHFEYEEQHMLKTGYPFFETHKNQHRMFIKRIQDIESSSSGSTRTLMILINFVFDWITNHILKSDFKYKDYI